MIDLLSQPVIIDNQESASVIAVIATTIVVCIIAKRERQEKLSK